MLSLVLKQHIESLLNASIISRNVLSGGDINDVYLIETEHEKLVLKVNVADRFPGMFEAEKVGLRLLSNTKTFLIPEVKAVGSDQNTAFLILEYIQPDENASNFSTGLGINLARLHQHHSNYFGLDIDNYIGSLPQYNNKKDTAADFYVEQRLIPQFKLAKENGYSFDHLERFYANIIDEIPNEPASLIHGDLWKGNFLIASDGMACLIDPAVCFASREMDIAMMHLFGGFSQTVFDSYNETYALPPAWKDRLAIWQLYYLLVHLNLFGRSYYHQVNTVIKRYS